MPKSKPKPKAQPVSLSRMDSLKNNIYVVLGIGLVLGFVIGSLYTKVNLLEKGGTVGTNQQGQNVQAQPTTGQKPPQELKIAKPDAKKDHWRGSADARYVLVQYSDFECPFCARFFPTTEQVRTEYGNKIAMVYRHFPLSFHPKALPAALASECVAELGGKNKFWEMHDVLFKSLETTEISGIAGLASSIGINKAALQTCIDSGKYKAKVQGQMNEGSQAGVAATPTSVIYDMETGKSETIEGALPYEQVKQVIDTFMKG